jgi:general stress protein 26
MMSTANPDMKGNCRALMQRVTDVFLTTVDEQGFPQTRCVFNLRCGDRFPGLQALFAGHDEDLMTYFGTNTSSLKVRQLRANPRVAAYYCEPPFFRGLMLSGRIEIIEDPALKRAVWQEDWLMYYRHGADDPDFALLRLQPLRACGWWQGAPFDFHLPAEVSQR